MRLPAFLVFLCYFILILSDLFIIYDLRRMSIYDKFRPLSKKTGAWWKVFSIFAALVIALLTVAVCLPKKSEAIGVTSIMWMLYAVLTVEFSQIVYCIFSLLGFIPKFFGSRRWNTGLWIGLPLAVLIFSMMWWGTLLGRYKIHTEYVTITSKRIPPSFDGYTIAQISDLHVGTWGTDTAFISRLVDSVNNLHPDLILFTGDAVNRESREFVPFMKTLSRLKAPDGVYSVLGNHDYGDYVEWKDTSTKKNNLDSLKAYQKEVGWTLLDNDAVAIKSEAGDSIILIGVGNWGEPPFKKYGDLKKAYPDYNKDKDNFKILMSHNPEHWNQEVSKISDIDLTLAGHTHAMQIMFGAGDRKWSPAKFRYQQWSGLYSRQSDRGHLTNLYVNIGAGEVGIPMRIGADPEITFITLSR